MLSLDPVLSVYQAAYWLEPWFPISPPLGVRRAAEVQSHPTMQIDRYRSVHLPTFVIRQIFGSWFAHFSEICMVGNRSSQIRVQVKERIFDSLDIDLIG